MSKTNKHLAFSFGDTKAIALTEDRTLKVIATAATLDRDLDVLDTGTARVPVKPTGWKYAQDLTLEDDIDIPFLLDHNQLNGIEKMAGSVKKMIINEAGELEALVSLSSVDNGERVYTLAKEGHLGNSFSIGFSMMNATEDDEAIKNYEIIELSCVFKGSNRNARIVDVKSVTKGGEAKMSLEAKIEAKRSASEKAIKDHLTKGIVADIASADHSWETEEDKWELMEPVWDLFSAMREAWYFSTTPVEDFETLVKELSDLLAEVAAGTYDDTKSMSEELTKALDGKTIDDVKTIVADLKAKTAVEETVAPIEEVKTEEAPAEVVADKVETTEEKTEDVKSEATVEEEAPAEPEAEEVAPVVTETETKTVETETPVEVTEDKTEVEAVEEVETTPEADTPTDVEAEPKQNEKSVKENKQMSKDIAKSMVAPADRADVETVVDTKYLSTTEALRDFANVLKSTAGKSAAEVKAAWAAHAATKGITNPEELLPEVIRNKIVSVLEDEGPIWSRLNKTGAKAFRVLIDESDPNADTSRAGGHTRGTTKDEEVVTLAPRLIRGQLIYKFIRIDRETEFEDDGALMAWVSEELPRKIIAEIERAVVIGDGRASNDKRKIREIVSVKEDSVSGDGYAVVYTPGAGETNYQKLVGAETLLEADGGRLLVASRAFVAGLRLQENANGGLVFAPGTDLADTLGFESIYTPRWMNQDADNDAYVFVPNAYYTVGQSNVEAFSDFALETNQYEYLQEIFVGGALAEAVSGVAISNSTASS